MSRHRLSSLKWISAVAALVLLLIAVVSAKSFAAPPISQSESASKQIIWQKDLAEAHESSLVSGKPMLIFFEAKWCGYCRKLKAETLETQELSGTINDKFIPVRIDLEAEPRIARVLEVKSVPCTIVLSPRADLLGRLVGYAKPTAYGNALTRALELNEKIEREFYSSRLER